MKRILFTLGLFTAVSFCFAQKPEDVYRRPLKEVLDDISRKYDITFDYNENIVRNMTVTYPGGGTDQKLRQH